MFWASFKQDITVKGIHFPSFCFNKLGSITPKRFIIYVLLWLLVHKVEISYKLIL